MKLERTSSPQSARIGRIAATGALLLGAVLAWAATSGQSAEDGESNLAQSALVDAPSLGGPRSAGVVKEPTPLGLLKPSHQMVDVQVQGTLAPFVFERRFSSVPTTWAPAPENVRIDRGSDELAFPPFGKSPEKPKSAQWTHSFYSAVLLRHELIGPLCPGTTCESRSVWSVRDSGGRTIDFEPCAGTPDPAGLPACFATGGDPLDLRTRLYWDGIGFVLYTPQGRHYFRAQSGRYAYYLSSIEDAQYSAVGKPHRKTLALAYAKPAGCTTLTLPSVPFLQSATNEDGVQLNFTWKELPNATGARECVLASVGRTGASVPLVEYTYKGAPGAERAGLLQGVSFPLEADGGVGRQVRYTYEGQTCDASGVCSATKTWTVEENGLVVAEKTLDQSNGHVVAETSPDQSFAVSADGPCLPGKLYGTSDAGSPPVVSCPETQKQHFTQTGSRASYLRHTYVVSNTVPGTATESYAVACVAGGGCSGFVPPPEQQWKWDWVFVGEQFQPGDFYFPTAERTANGSWNSYRYSRSVVNGYTTPLELVKVMKGATSELGDAPVSTKDYTYTYAGEPPTGEPRAFEQLLKTQEEDSVIPERPRVVRQLRYEPGTNRLMAVIRKGSTRVIGSAAVQDRYVGTFYLTRRSCSGEAADDAFGRTLEVHGPCLVADLTATECSGVGPVPVTQYVYDTADASRPGRLLREVKYTSGVVAGAGGVSCAGAAKLETHYRNHDWRGRPGEVVDANGVVTRNEYRGDFLVKSTVVATDGSGVSTEYAYDEARGQLQYVRYPAGYYEVHCYRTGTSGDTCTGGQPTDKLMWKAKSVQKNGSGWTEKVAYTYLDGEVVREESFDRDGLRLVKRFTLDPLGRVVGEARGADAYANHASHQVLGAYGETGLDKLSAPYNGMGNYPRELEKDRLGRLKSMTEYSSAAAAGERTHVTYDKQGNPSAVASGCSASSVVDCPAANTTYYEHDDFGNLVSMRAPWTDNGSGAAGTTRFEYDAAGNLLRKQTPQMEPTGDFLAYEYDLLGRLRTLKLNSQPALLYELLYDEAPAGGGAATCSPAGANAKGRAYLRRDSFGSSWFSYNALGSVTRIHRLRNGASGTCRAERTEETPNSEFEYAPDGRLVAETYPHGRTVRYAYYGPGGAYTPDRVQAFSVDTFPKQVSGPNNAPVGITLLQAVKWEPYGGLRSYEAVANGASGSTLLSLVEYRMGEVQSTPVDSCAAVPSGNDFTGRHRGLWVSRLAATAGTGSGDIFKRTYKWRGELVVQQDTCLLTNSSTDKPRSERYQAADGSDGYDRLLRLTNVSRSPREFAERGGATGHRSYGYGARGNRVREVRESWDFTYGYGNAAHPDRLTSVRPNSCDCSRSDISPTGCAALCQTTPHSLTFAYDRDGRVLHKEWFTGSPQSYALAFDGARRDGTSVPTTAASPVYKSVSVGGAAHEYLYDANGRRRLKVYPDGATDEFFYDGDKLLEDFARHRLFDAGGVPLSNADGTPAERYQLDEYLWLDGRPVALLKSTLQRDSAGQLARMADSSGDCGRDDASAPCGAYALVTDYLGKPVLMLDAARRVSGAADYEPFGHVNRATYLAQRTPGAAARKGAMAFFNQKPATANEVVDVRARFALLDTGANVTEAAGNYAFFSNDAGGELLAVGASPLRLSGQRAGRVVSDWVAPPPNGRIHLRYRFAGAAQPASLQGVVLEGYEYRRYEKEASPVWTPLRFPGQYHDAETDLFENWNRYYDPSVGRYLGPEPMYQDPDWVLKQVASGHAPEIYAYARNNPIVYTDPDGLEYDTKQSPTSGREIEKLCKEDSAAGDGCRKMRDRTDLKIVFKEKIAAQDPALKAAGGALSEVTKGQEVVDSKTGEVKKVIPTEITTTIDFALATSAESAAAAKVNAFAPDQVIRHEVGHDRAFSLGYPKGHAMHKTLSLMFENTARSVPRTFHAGFPKADPKH